MKKNSIVRILAASALLTLSLAATSFAAKGDKEVDLGVGFATAPTPSTGVPGATVKLDTGWGLTVGGGYELLEVSAIRGSTLQFRGDIGYNKWTGKVDVNVQGATGSVDVKYTRIPVSAGARLYVPLEAVKNLRVYGEADLELSFDKAESGDVSVSFLGQTITAPGSGISASENHFGISPAAGVEYVVTPNIFVGAALKYHIITDAYLTGAVNVGYKF